MKKLKDTRFLVQLAMLVALQVILAATPLGYIRLVVMDLTIMHIPVLIGAIALGPVAGGVLGTVFGITSLMTAISQPSLTNWPFNPVVTGSFYSVCIALIPRILVGVLAGWLFSVLIKTKMSQRVAAGLAAAAGSLCNTVLVLGGIYVLFGTRYSAELGITPAILLTTIGGIVATNGLAEMAAAVVICVALVKPLRSLGSSWSKK